MLAAAVIYECYADTMHVHNTRYCSCTGDRIEGPSTDGESRLAAV